jgi:hypothetical protein
MHFRMGEEARTAASTFLPDKIILHREDGFDGARRMKDLLFY